MTVICALHEPGVGTWIGTDSQATIGGDRVLPGPIAKHVEVGRFWLLMSGHPRSRSLVEQNAEALAKHWDVFALATAIRDVLKADGWHPTGDKGEAEDFGQRVIFAAPEGIWDSDGSFNLVPWPSGELCARGSGCEIALGAAHALRGRPPQDRVRAALDAACAINTGCGGPLFIRLVEA